MKVLSSILLIALSLTGLNVASVRDAHVSLFVVLGLVLIPIIVMVYSLGARAWSFGGVFPIVAYMLTQSVFFVNTAKLTSVAYSLVFLVSFMCFMNCRRALPEETLAAVLKAVIVAYFLNTVISQLLVVTGVPDTFLGTVFHRAYDVRVDRVRFFGFSSEPSYASFVVLTSYLGLFLMTAGKSWRLTTEYGAMTLYLVVAFGSIYGYILAAAVASVLAYHLARKQVFWILPVIVIMTVGIYQVEHTGNSRLSRLLSGLASGDMTSIEALNLIDSSVFMRVAPFVKYFDTLDPMDPHTYFGHGAMASTGFFTDEFLTHVNPEAGLIRPGFFPAFAYDYGVIGAILVLLVIGRLISTRLWSLQNLFFVAVLFNANFNTQLFWYVVAVFALTKPYAEHLAIREQVTMSRQREALAV
ncbi:MAG: hypothetical protein D6800_06075 [Candidatus Zixiibacteriota bacterium]|nr:MAG: hypothetical protein D6800_06075 [candidate division Zixibacteria bacterium]